MNAFLSRYGEWFYRGVVLLALAAFWVGNFRSNYATKADVTNAVAPVRSQVTSIFLQVTSLDKNLALLAEQHKVNGRQDDSLRDLELRMRAVERRP